MTILYNERTPEGARENCHAEEIFRYVNHRVKAIAPDMPMLRVGVPKQLMREVGAYFMEPYSGVDSIDEGKDLRDAYPKLTHMKYDVNHEIMAIVRRVLGLEMTGDCLYEPTNQQLLDGFIASMREEDASIHGRGNPSALQMQCR